MRSPSTPSVTVGGKALAYQAVAGTLIVHPRGWDDVPRDPNAEKPAPGEGVEPRNPTAEASMFYVAYFKTGGSGPRPITFLYNGGPGSSTVWLHMGAFGPRRIVTSTDAHTPAAPYSVVNNASSLLDVTDLVFIDAPGTGFSRIAGRDKEKAFFGVDPDAYAFAEFLSQFLTKYGRWNSPKYLFGESYGTPRAAVLVNQLETERSVDLNGVILLSQNQLPLGAVVVSDGGKISLRVEGGKTPGFAGVIGEGKIGAIVVGMFVVASGDYSVAGVAEGDGENSGGILAVKDGGVEDFPGLAAVRGVEDAGGFAASGEPKVGIGG